MNNKESSSSLKKSFVYVQMSKTEFNNYKM